MVPLLQLNSDLSAILNFLCQAAVSAPKLAEDKFAFRKKGNKRQFMFNKIVDKHLDVAMEDLQNIPKLVDDKTAKVLAKMEEEPVPFTW